jgi:nucleotide-binding universal stress UspA family protein
MTTLIRTLPTTRFKEILLATDFSDESRRALMAAKNIAQHFDAEICAVNVTETVNPVSVPEAMWLYSPEDLRWAEERMEQFAAELRSEGFKAKGSSPAGPVVEAILQTAEEMSADLVVTGSHARLGSRRWIYGSIAEDVARKAKLPLLMVGPSVPEQFFAQGWNPQRILCAATMDDDGEYVVRYTEALAREFRAHWELACDYYDNVGEYCAWDKFRERLEGVLSHDGRQAEPIRSVLLEKPYAQSLAEVARRHEADLLVIGHSDHLLKWSVLRSGTIPHLLAEANIPVLTVPSCK